MSISLTGLTSIPDFSNIDVLKSFEFSDPKDVYYLNLQSGRISKIEGLDSLVNLHSLTLINNQISKIEGLDSLVNLQYLYLNENKISKIEGLDSLVNLQCLYLGNLSNFDINTMYKLQKLPSLYHVECLNGYELKTYLSQFKNPDKRLLDNDHMDQ